MNFERYTFSPQLCNRKELMGFAYVYKSKWHLIFLGCCGVLVQASHHFAINVYHGNTTEIHPWKCDSALLLFAVKKLILAMLLSEIPQNCIPRIIETCG